MKLIVCFDKKYGVLFGQKRVSVDSVVISKIKEIAGDEILNVSKYSAPLFYEKNINIVDDIASVKEGFFFVEDFVKEVDFRRFEEVYTFGWMTEYPSTIKLTEAQIALLEGMEIAESDTIKGSSHPEIKYVKRINRNVVNDEPKRIGVIAKIKNLFKRWKYGKKEK